MEYYIFIILNLILMESLLSVDNAAVLAVMVQDLPDNQKNKALRYGILGAYVLRGVCLLFAAYLVKILWLKIAGGIYLCYLTYRFFTKQDDANGDGIPDSKQGFIYTHAHKLFGTFWSTVILVEIMDLTFSIDNIFAAVAFTPNIYLICTGVFIGILAMRFIAQYFVMLMQKYPFLERTTFIVIAILGIKLILSGICDYIPGNPITPVLNNHLTDICFSICILLMFFLPILFKHKAA